MGFKGELINGASKDKAPKALKDKAPITIPRTLQKKDALTCYCGAIYWF